MVLGPSGEVGRELVRTLVETNAYSKIVTASRRKIEIIHEPSSDKNHAVNTQNITQVVPVDYDNEEAIKAMFEENKPDVVFCCLGTTRGISGKEGFYRVDHDYVMLAAKTAKSTGVSTFSICSASNANINSMFYYPKVKGQVEAELKQVGLEKLSIFQPGFLECNRENERIGEKIAGYFLPVAKYFFPDRISVLTSSVAKAMVYDSLLKVSETPVVKTYSNSSIIDIGNDFYC
ncbi:Oxidoreductase HTATIP2 [Smittium culicis]|uniref:Oxidoreductase HTATIP2 n=1 Tax=Smittium culicis TaxID=133412 RepID=A0A1R1X5V3_9FUNG|nr:Oxidoreductase HTATIP2 [Smittium culicis]OMJ28063.1 Oxidoreductase HTATIP2 [Smittium culicis]